MSGKYLYPNMKDFHLKVPLGMGFYFNNSTTPATFDTDYQAILDRGTALGYALPSIDQRVKQNTFVLALKDAGVWTKTDVLWVFATDGDSDFATLNWKTPASFQCTKVLLPTFASNQGFTGDGLVSYLNTNWAPNPDAVNFLLDSASAFNHTNTNVAESSFDYGGRQSTTTRTQLNPRNATDLASVGINSTGDTTANTNSIGFYLNNRSGATAADHDIYKNGVLLDGTLAGSSGRTNTPIFICGGSTSGVLELPSTRQVSMVGFGGSLLAEQAALYTAWNTYFTSL